MANWQPDNNSLMQVIQLLKESQFPCNETQRAIQQVTISSMNCFRPSAKLEAQSLILLIDSLHNEKLFATKFLILD